VPVGLAIAALSWPVLAAREIHFQSEFAPNGAAAPGWSYLWNRDGALWNPVTGAGLPGNYKPLVRDSSGNWETAANGAYPDPSPGNALRVSSTGAVPGAGSTQDAQERFAIVAYTIQPSDITAAGGSGSILGVMTDYTFSSLANPGGTGVNPAIFVNATAVIPPGFLNLPPGFTYDRSDPTAYDVPLGNLVAGDTIYVAVGSGLSDVGDALAMDFTIALAPEPGTMSLAGIAAIALCRRGRRP
jgi:hypothetical protein